MMGHCFLLIFSLFAAFPAPAAANVEQDEQFIKALSSAETISNPTDFLTHFQSFIESGYFTNADVQKRHSFGTFFYHLGRVGQDAAGVVLESLQDHILTEAIENVSLCLTEGAARHGQIEVLQSFSNSRLASTLFAQHGFNGNRFWSHSFEKAFVGAGHVEQYHQVMRWLVGQGLVVSPYNSDLSDGLIVRMMYFSHQINDHKEFDETNLEAILLWFQLSGVFPKENERIEGFLSDLKCVVSKGEHSRIRPIFEAALDEANARENTKFSTLLRDWMDRIGLSAYVETSWVTPGSAMVPLASVLPTTPTNGTIVPADDNLGVPGVGGSPAAVFPGQGGQSK